MCLKRVSEYKWSDGLQPGSTAAITAQQTHDQHQCLSRHYSYVLHGLLMFE